MKKIISLLIAVIMCFSVIAVSANEMDDVQVIAYDYGINFEQKPVLVNDRTFVEFKSMAEFFLKDGAIEEEATYDPETGKVVIGTMEFTIGSSEVRVGEEIKSIDAEVFGKENTVFVPLRFISETLGYTVEWQGFEPFGDGGFAMLSK